MIRTIKGILEAATFLPPESLNDPIFMQDWSNDQFGVDYEEELEPAETDDDTEED